jgi:N-acetylmuramic acid 6-phosphate (MurNAc-6-P) etherase
MAATEHGLANAHKVCNCVLSIADELEVFISPIVGISSNIGSDLLKIACDQRLDANMLSRKVTGITPEALTVASA